MPEITKWKVKNGNARQKTETKIRNTKKTRHQESKPTESNKPNYKSLFLNHLLSRGLVGHLPRTPPGCPDCRPQTCHCSLQVGHLPRTPPEWRWLSSTDMPLLFTKILTKRMVGGTTQWWGVCASSSRPRYPTSSSKGCFLYDCLKEWLRTKEKWNTIKLLKKTKM